MGRKKILDGSGQTSKAQDSLEAKPFCYYCDREFDSIKTLVQHQRTKHFNCAECGLKFDTVTGLRVHLLNAYKRTMKEVPNAIPGRENPDVVVHGMEGLPKSILEERTRKASAERAERDKEKAERAAARAAERPPAEPPPPPPAAAIHEEAPPPPPASILEAAPPAPPPPGPMSAVPPPVPPPQPPPPTAINNSGISSAERSSSAAASAPMPKLSPSVAKLLAGAGKTAPGEGKVTVPGRPDVLVPPSLSGLHTIALQMLAACGALGGAVQSASHDTSHVGVGLLNSVVPMAVTNFVVEPDVKRARLTAPGL